MSSGRPADHTARSGHSAGDAARLRGSVAVRSVRYGIGAVMVLGGIVVLIVDPGGFGVDGFAMAVGGGLSVLMINFLFRLGVSGDLEREAEEEARRFFDEHGYWPDEAPRSR